MIHRLIMLLILCGYTTQLNAHPHEWMNIIIEPKFDKQNNIVELAQTWMFDPLYAQILLEPVLEAQTNNAQREGMKKIEQQIIAKLAQNQYYTFSDSQFAPAQQQKLYVEDGYLYFAFHLPLVSPQHELSFKVYEPTYYVEIRYDDIKQQTHWTNGCTLTITESSPSLAMLQAAYAIDIDEKGPNNLGQHFAQHSQLKCPTI